MDLVDEEDGVRVVLKPFEHRFKTLLEVTAVLGSGQQGPHVERIDVGLGQDLGHVALDHLACQTLGDRRLADARFSNQQRVVLAAAAKGLDDPFELLVAADQRIDLPLQRECVEVDRVLL